jgi:hypothetical protein
MNKVFKFALVAVISLSMMACSSVAESEDTVGLVLSESNFKIYSAADFQIQYPVNWSVLSKSEVSSKFKESLEVAFISNFKDLFFTPVITVEKVQVTAGITSEQFADSVIARNSANLIDYALVDRQSMSTLVKGQTVLTSIAQFTGKEKLADDTLSYLQTFLVAGDIGYIVTGAYDSTDNRAETEKMTQSLRTFRLK